MLTNDVHMEGEKIALAFYHFLISFCLVFCPRCLREVYKRFSATKQWCGFFCTEIFKVG